MTRSSFNQAQEILDKINKVQTFKSAIWDNLCIKKNKDSQEKYMYLSWVDTKDNDLKKLLLRWCDERIKELQQEFEEL